MSFSKLIRVLFVLVTLSLHPSSAAKYEFRNVSEGDLDAVVNTILSAFDPGEMFTYLYQFRDTFPDYHLRCFHEAAEEQFPHYQNATGVFGNVIVPSVGGNRDAQSFAMWKMMKRGDVDENSSMSDFSGQLFGWPMPRLQDLTVTPPEAGSVSDESFRQGLIQEAQATIKPGRERVNEIKLPCSLHLDMNLVRGAHLSPQLEKANEHYIEDAYEYQLYLGTLATHPDWDGNGFGAAQVKWGMELAKAEEQRLSLAEGRKVKVPVTLLATPAGYPLYRSLGFESVANITLILLDSFQGSTTWFEYMRWFSDDTTM